MVAKSEIDSAKVIVELGPGTGAITKEILEKMPEDCDLWTFEINKDFVSHLKENYPHLYFVSSTTKVLTEFSQLVNELDSDDFSYVVPDFRLNKALDKLSDLTTEQIHG